MGSCSRGRRGVQLLKVKPKWEADSWQSVMEESMRAKGCPQWLFAAPSGACVAVEM